MILDRHSDWWAWLHEIVAYWTMNEADAVIQRILVIWGVWERVEEDMVVDELLGSYADRKG